MRKTFFCAMFLVLIVQLNMNAQILHPVKWSYAVKKTGGNTAVLLFKASIDNGWHIYSAYQPEGGPVKTSFLFNPDKAFTLSGKISEPKPVTEFEKTFGMHVSYFEREVTFQQKINLKAGTRKTPVKGSLTYMSCNNEKCLPPEDVNFSILVN